MGRERALQSNRGTGIGLLAAILALTGASGALAQSPIPGGLGPAEVRPLPTPPPPNGFQFSIESGRPSPVPRAVEELRFELRGVNIVGAKALTEDELKAIYGPFVGKQIGFGDLLDIAAAIESAYRAKGYAIVRAYVPPQRVGNGIFTINVVEGYVNAIAIDGGDPGVRDLITAYTAPVLAARPLDLSSVERGLLLSNDLPGVQATALLRPSPDQPGASDMVVTVGETPYSGGLNFDNRGSQFTDRWTIGGDAQWNSPTGVGDQFYGNVQMAPDPTERIAGTLRYQRPLGTDGLTGTGFVTVSNGAPAGLGGGLLNVTTNSLAVGPRLSYPLERSRAESLTLEGGLTYENATVNVAGLQLSHDRWRVADVGLTYTQMGFWSGNTTAVIDLAQGLPIFGANRDSDPTLSRQGAHTDFTKFTASVKRVQLITGPFTAALNVVGQYSPVPLVVGEQITFGGYEIGRGYEPSALSGDSGVGASGELRYDRQFDSFVQTVQPYVFFDAGRIWNQFSTAGDGTVESTGAGVRFSMMHNITGGIEFAHTLRAVPGSDNGHTTSKVLVNGAIRF